MAAVCGQTSVWPGANFPGIPTPHMAATQSVGRNVAALTEKLETFMPHLTTPLAFHETGPAHHNHLLFSVTPDIPAVHALHSASELLSAATHTLDAAATGTPVYRRPSGVPAGRRAQVKATVAPSGRRPPTDRPQPPNRTASAARVISNTGTVSTMRDE